MPRAPDAAVLILSVLTLCAPAACTQFPELDDALSPGAEAADYPALVPVEQIRQQVPQARPADQTRDDLTDRVTALRQRADGLRGSVIAPSERARLEAGIGAP